MIDLTTAASPEDTIEISVRVSARRAQMLWFAAASAATFDFDDRFENTDGDGGIYVHDADAWPVGTVMWCERALEVMTLADYETSSGYRSRILWDLDYGPGDSGSYAVLTSRPFSY